MSHDDQKNPVVPASAPVKQSRYRRRRSKVVVGASPGTIVIDPSAPKPMIRVTAFDPKELYEHTIDDLTIIPDIVKQWPVVWIQIVGLGDKTILQQLGTMFNLHRLILEDITNVVQRPKIEQYEDHYFIIARILESIGGRYRGTQQFSIYLDKNVVLSFQEHDVAFLDGLKSRLRLGTGRLRHSGPDYLCYTLIDSVVDHYFPVLEATADQLDHIEIEMETTSRTKVLSDLHGLRHDLMSMRRAIWPLRDVLNVMLREESEVFTSETRLHLRDCSDHAVQIIELVESYRELAASLMELSLSQMSHRLNEGIRILTVISTIFIPLNFIAGVYGMNFHTDKSPWNMPELGWKYGYIFSLSLMGLVAVGQLLFFWKKGWLAENNRGL